MLFIKNRTVNVDVILSALIIQKFNQNKIYKIYWYYTFRLNVKVLSCYVTTDVKWNLINFLIL